MEENELLTARFEEHRPHLTAVAHRMLGSRAEAEAWARPEEGEQVVELNVLCDCDL